MMKHAVHEQVSATELVRNLSSMIDKVRITRQSIYITKGNQTIAELSPPPKSGYPLKNLVALLESLPKLGDDAEQMAKDLERIRKNSDLPENPWE